MPEDQKADQQQTQQAPQTVPYERLAEVSHQNQEYRKRIDELTRATGGYEAKLKEMEEKLNFISSNGQKMEDYQRQKAEQEKFYQDPYGHVRQIQDMTRKEIEGLKGTVMEEWDYNLTMQQLRAAPTYSQEIENSMIKFLNKHPHVKNGSRGAAIKAAYEAATGQEWGNWQGAGYSTRMTKERLARPGSGSGDEAMSREKYMNLPDEEYKKDPGKYDRAYMAWYESQQK